MISVNNQPQKPVGRARGGRPSGRQYSEGTRLYEHAPYEGVCDELSKAMVKKFCDICAADKGQSLKLLEIWLCLSADKRPTFLSNIKVLNRERYRKLSEYGNCLQKLNIWPMSKWSEQVTDVLVDHTAFPLIEKASQFMRRTTKQERNHCATECTVKILSSFKCAALQNDTNNDIDCDDADADDDDANVIQYQYQPKTHFKSAYIKDASQSHIDANLLLNEQTAEAADSLRLLLATNDSNEDASAENCAEMNISDAREHRAADIDPGDNEQQNIAFENDDTNNDCDDADDDDDVDDDANGIQYQYQPHWRRPQTSLKQHIRTDTMENVFLTAEELLKTESLENEYRHFIATMDGPRKCRLSKMQNIVKNPRIHQQGQFSFLAVLDSILFAPKQANTLTVLQVNVNKSVKRWAIVTDENEASCVSRINDKRDIPPPLSSLSGALDFTSDPESAAFQKYKREFMHWFRVHVQINRTVDEYKKQHDTGEHVNTKRIRDLVETLVSKRCTRAVFTQTLRDKNIAAALTDALWHDLGGAPLSKTELTITKAEEQDDDADIGIEQLNEAIRETLDVDVSVRCNVGNHAYDGGVKCDVPFKHCRNSNARTKNRNVVKKQLARYKKLKTMQIWSAPSDSQRIAFNALVDVLWRLIHDTRWTLVPCLDHGCARDDESASLLHCVEYQKPKFVDMLWQMIPHLNESNLIFFPMYDADEKRQVDLHALCVDSEPDRPCSTEFAIALQVEQQNGQVSVCGIHVNTRAIRQRYVDRYLCDEHVSPPSSWRERTHFFNPHRIEVYENACQSMMATHCVQLMEHCLTLDDDDQIKQHVENSKLKMQNYNYVADDFKQDETLWTRERQMVAHALKSTHVCKLWCIFTVAPSWKEEQKEEVPPCAKHCWYTLKTAFTDKCLDQIVEKGRIDRFEIYAKHPSYSVFPALKEIFEKRENWNRQKFDEFFVKYKCDAE